MEATSVQRRGKYRRYFYDPSIKVTRNTLWRYRKRDKKVCSSKGSTRGQELSGIAILNQCNP